MTTTHPIEWLSIKGFKSIRNLERLRLGQVNLLIGANGAGKSNFVSYFYMMKELIEGRLQNWTRIQGSADRIVSFGVKETKRFEACMEFGSIGYKFVLEPAVDGGFAFSSEQVFSNDLTTSPQLIPFGAGHVETKLPKPLSKVFLSRVFLNKLEASLGEKLTPFSPPKIVEDVRDLISNWKIFHFHDTSDTSGVKRLGSVQDNDYLRPDASNLAAYLYRLLHESSDVYQQIRQTIQLAMPFFDDFVLKPQKLPTEEEQIRLLWRQKDSDYSLWPSQLSDGSVRFICLVTALLQPDPPSTIIIDEPELGLHPYAIALLASLLRSASKRMQVVVSTQSVSLVNEFSIDDLIVVERERAATVFKRKCEKDFEAWLEDYSTGELWEKNILGGRPGE